MSNMSHLPSFFTTDPHDDLAAPVAEPNPGSHPGGNPGAFAWPTPPYAIYPTSLPQQEPEPCEIEGQNGKVMQASLLAFLPAQNVIQLVVPPARKAMALRPNRFRRITLLTPLRPSFMDRGAVPPELTDFHPSIDYRVDLVDGNVLTGRTVGHVELPEGLFLFPPMDDQGTVQRLFCPRDVYARFQLGESLGSMLVAEDTASPAQIAEVLAVQSQLRERRLGDVLLSQDVVTREQLETALETQASMPMVRIGEALLAMGYISQNQLDAALIEQRSNRTVPLGELLVRAGYIKREALRSALARKMGYPVVQIETYPVDPAALRLVPFGLAQRLNVLPLQTLPGRLVVAMDDPSRKSLIDELSFASRSKVIPVLAATEDLAQPIISAYQRHGLIEQAQVNLNEPTRLSFDEKGTEHLLADLEQIRMSETDALEDPPIEQSDNTLVRLINTMIVEANSQGASDIHIEPQPGRGKLRVRFRLDGVLKPYLELPHTYRNALVARIKIMCDLDISERRRPQDGKINFARFVPSCPIELRVATIPTNNGLEDVVLRLLASNKALPPIEKLGLSPHNLLALKEAINRPYGLVLCVGPTGSGKTTTLHSALSCINTPERKIWTAEDPVEITQAGLRQVQVNPKIGWTFAKALRAFLRADPDVIMVGEIRDEETAQIAIEASLTGHLVLSTLHTNNAPETITRLLDMGMDPFNFADSLLAVLAQRLVRRLCPHCLKSSPLGAADLDELLEDHLHGFAPDIRPGRDELLAQWRQVYGSQGQLMHHHAAGCPQCENTGFKGRAGLHELLSVSREIRRLIQTGARAEEIQHQAQKEGLRTLRQDGIVKVLQGITTLGEVRATSNT